MEKTFKLFIIQVILCTNKNSQKRKEGITIYYLLIKIYKCPWNPSW